MDKQLIGDYLIHDGLVKPDQLAKALEVQASRIERGRMPLIGTVLVEMGAVNEQDLTFALEEQERERMRVAT